MGYLRLSVTVLPEGAELKTIHDQIDDDDLVDVLMPPSIEMVGAHLILNCYRGDGLPELDDMARAGRGCRALRPLPETFFLLVRVC